MTGRKKGQCCHKEVVGNKTFFCVEPTGHQCAHFYFVTIEDLQSAIARAEANNAALRRLLLRWLQIINRAKKDAATVAEWDKLRQETDAAMREGRND